MALYNISTKQEFKEKVLDNPKLVLVDFWASWCPPCVAMTPHLEAVGKDLDSIADVVKIDIENRPDTVEAQMLAAEYGVQSIPNMPVFAKGREVERFIGMTPKAQLAKVLIDLSQTT
ncbi:MAG: thioredoxin family protein [Candidatus Saccharimonadales bacterium]